MTAISGFRDRIAAGLRLCFEDHVERHLSGAPTLRKPPAVMTSRNLASPGCAPRAAPTSCDSEVGTHHGRAGVVDASDRVQIVFEFVARHRLDDNQRAVGL
jgi:hypothetical protein